jgi:hypothetical protein
MVISYEMCLDLFIELQIYGLLYSMRSKKYPKNMKKNASPRKPRLHSMQS